MLLFARRHGRKDSRVDAEYHTFAHTMREARGRIIAHGAHLASLTKPFTAMMARSGCVLA
jgi:hypothetical protein